jgi:hypothetical protein
MNELTEQGHVGAHAAHTHNATTEFWVGIAGPYQTKAEAKESADALFPGRPYVIETVCTVCKES